MFGNNCCRCNENSLNYPERWAVSQEKGFFYFLLNRLLVCMSSSSARPHVIFAEVSPWFNTSLNEQYRILWGCPETLLFTYAILTFFLWHTIFTLSIGTPYLFTIFVLKFENSPFYYLLMCLKYCCMYGKQWRPCSDAAFCGIWSGSTLFAKAYLSQYLGLLW